MAYTYDDRYQLETEARYTSTAQTTGVYRYTWSYDDAGNRLTQLKEEWDSGWTDKNYWEYTYNAANQLIDEDRWDDDNYTTWEAETIYAYDDAGNMTDKDIDNRPGIGVDEAWDYTYNYENRQTKVEKDTGEGMAEVGEYIYSVLGNRVSREMNQTTTYEMYYDGADCVGDDDGSTERYFITPNLDENLMINNGSDYFYTQDGLGSVRELINTSKATQNTYDYEAFGSFYGTPTEGVSNNWFTYTSREWDSESKTYYYRARQYCSHSGRFDQRDPIPGVNPYYYVINNPSNYTDPLGLIVWALIKNKPVDKKSAEKAAKETEKEKKELLDSIKGKWLTAKIWDDWKSKGYIKFNNKTFTGTKKQFMDKVAREKIEVKEVKPDKMDDLVKEIKDYLKKHGESWDVTILTGHGHLDRKKKDTYVWIKGKQIYWTEFTSKLNELKPPKNKGEFIYGFCSWKYKIIGDPPALVPYQTVRTPKYTPGTKYPSQFTFEEDEKGNTIWDKEKGLPVLKGKACIAFTPPKAAIKEEEK